MRDTPFRIPAQTKGDSKCNVPLLCSKSFRQCYCRIKTLSSLVISLLRSYAAAFFQHYEVEPLVACLISSITISGRTTNIFSFSNILIFT